MGEDFAESSIASIEELRRREWITTETTLRRLAAWGVVVNGKRLVDMGCGNGGGTLAFGAAGAHVEGFDLNDATAAQAQTQARHRGLHVTFRAGNVMEPPVPAQQAQAELVILQEVVEHVPDVRRTLRAASAWLSPAGYCFVSFPPYFSAVGGHHQGARKPFRYMPWLHLLIPSGRLIELLPEDVRYRDEVRTLNRLTIAHFEQSVEDSGLRIVRHKAYLIRPSISLQTGLPVVAAGPVAGMPGLRELLVTGVEYLLQKNGAHHG